ncbi:hypothetical protein DPEC_G00004730 [Dallia pectoralis]|uniref:Uncharacterized protein n=1 Tax=Dallia pectoralis TaxID=75939 RepID=A0ACC2HJW5_DALPE|nr:hypothetical protein DPEC_G00004730 [Dallia pectoralis]
MAPNPCNPIRSHSRIYRHSLQSLRSGLVAELTSVLETQLNSAIEAAVTPAVEAALAPLSSMLDGIRSTAEEQGRLMDAFEHDKCDYSDRIVALEETVARLSSENQQLKDKTDDLESRSRRCNLRIVGIPEKMERGDPVGFMTGFSRSVAKKRALFLDIKRRLSEKKVKFSLRFPARLFLEHAGERLTFDSYEDAQRWFDRHF